MQYTPQRDKVSFFNLFEFFLKRKEKVFLVNIDGDINESD